MTGDRVRGKQLHDLADHKERRGDHSFHAVLAWWFVVSVLSSLSTIFTIDNWNWNTPYSLP